MSSSQLADSALARVFFLNSSWMQCSVILFDAGVVFWLIRVFPSLLISLPLVVQFIQNIELLAPYSCWYLAFQVYRDEVKGNSPFAYDDFFTEAMLAISLLVVRVCGCLAGGWRPLWIKSRWPEGRIVRVFLCIHDKHAYKRQLGRLSEEGLFLQFLFGLFLYWLVSIVNDVTAALSSMYIMALRLQIWCYMCNPPCVTGLCRKAFDWQLSLSGFVLRITTWMNTYVMVLQVFCSCYFWYSTHHFFVTGPCQKALARQLWLPGSVTNGMGEMPFDVVFVELFLCLSASFGPSRCSNSCMLVQASMFDSTLSYFGK